MNVAAVVFDMDGLLLDSERLALAAFVDTCDHFGLGDQTAVFMQCLGINQERGKRVLRDGLPGTVDHLAFARLWDSKCFERFADASIPLKSGAEELLQDLKAFGVPAAIATSTSASRATQKLQHSGILQEFDVIVGGDHVRRSKPFPDIYLKAAELLGVHPESCLALEDSENGVRSALSAGMIVIQVPDLVQPSAAMRELGHTVLETLHDVRVWHSAMRSASPSPLATVPIDDATRD